MKTTLGGDRLGSGNKLTVNMRNFERSTFDLSYLFRTTMSSGTLVPFMCELALPGDTFDIDLNAHVLTHPTIGPLFGSYKVQLDVFQVPIRLYHSALHMNMIDIGMKMNTVKLPKLNLNVNNIIDPTEPIDNQQINPSSIFAYLGIRGCGLTDREQTKVARKFNAIPFLAYWEIYKQYYSAKNEGIGCVIHTEPTVTAMTISTATIDGVNIPITNLTTGSFTNIDFTANSSMVVDFSTTIPNDYPMDAIMIVMKQGGVRQDYSATELFEGMTVNDDVVTFHHYKNDPDADGDVYGVYVNTNYVITQQDIKPGIVQFDLQHIDDMKIELLQSAPVAEYVIDDASLVPYSLPFMHVAEESFRGSMLYSQEGLALKTYQSDLFNNWVDTEWLDGVNGISAVTAVSTAGNNFTIDELNLSKKVYEMLARIAVSGGTYDDWLGAVFTHERTRGQESPMYIGGLIKELVFQEVVSNTATKDDPLGTLAGRGTLNGKHKGGHVIAKVDEPSYIMGIVSITPRIDYSQGNKFHMSLDTLDDIHKPNLDQIGFQSLVTDKMAWFDTKIGESGALTMRSAGKQPAWIDYMSNTNVVRGNFAEVNSQMYMTLNRRYEASKDGSYTWKIKDLTTYVDPAKFNHIFADSRLDSQNFWTQISCDIKARRKMSSKLIPNL